MKERDRLRAERLDAALTAYEAQKRSLPGIADLTTRDVLLAQLVDSLHRVEYPRRLLERPVSVRRTDPAEDGFFDPVRAAVYHARHGDHDEACWLVFLFVAYGKGKRTGWRLIRDVYGRLRKGGRWDWATVSGNPKAVGEWIIAHDEALWPKGSSRPFGAHRQHETVKLTARSIETYVAWIGAAGHRTKFEAAAAASDEDPRRTFDVLYRDMESVYRFGRLGKFDYLTMLGKLALAPVEPGSAYMTGATGPVAGARLLFSGDPKADLSALWLDAQLVDLDAYLGVGMQVLEDALCNWQKNPTRFRRFRG
ncbi:MAG TPA: hypothetical protein VFK04_04995 [Gemmatimonadaceae bacterium]|nr:hypothetical protein [Gemmatimonadaceae bacterium]